MSYCTGTESYDYEITVLSGIGCSDVCLPCLTAGKLNSHFVCCTCRVYGIRFQYVCKYKCNDGYVYNPITETCDLLPAMGSGSSLTIYLLSLISSYKRARRKRRKKARQILNRT